MGVYDVITWCYRAIFALLTFLFAVHVVRHAEITKNLLGVIVLLPLLLRLFSVK